MRFVGKYSFVKRDKQNKIIQKITKNNVITETGQQQILKLLCQNQTDNFQNTVGYDVLDLKNRKIHPVFSTSGTTRIQGGDESSGQFINQLVTDDYSVIAPENSLGDIVQWQVVSSFFMRKKWGGSLETNTPIKSNYYAPNNGSTVFNYYVRITDNEEFSDSDVDRLLLKDNMSNVNWSGHTNNNERYLCYDVQNIDFFRVFCRQRVVVGSRNQIIQLWQGRTKQDENWENKLKVIYKFDLSQSGYNNAYYNDVQNGSVCLRAKYRKFGTSGQFTYFNNNNDVIVNCNEGTVKLCSTVIPQVNDWNNSIQVVLQYYVHYKDDRIKNGICGLYINYDYITQNISSNATDHLTYRSLFGNGVFSDSTGLDWDDCICFPWCGRPIKYGNYSYLRNNTTDIGTWFSYDQYPFSISLINKHQDKIDNTPKRFYSFYPYVYKNATNFHFLASFRGEKIRIKNFLFLTPKFTPQAPNVFVFGDGENIAQSEDRSLSHQMFRKSAQQSRVSFDEIENNVVVKWTTVLDFQQANQFEIKQVGMNFGQTFMKKTKDNWFTLKPIDIDECNNLFSRVVLPTAIIKDEQSTVQVSYEIGLQ